VGARETLKELNDRLSEILEGRVRDIVNTVTWISGSSVNKGGVGS
jgi:hypothetical protein